MKCLRVYATPDGESRFNEVDLPMTTSLAVAPDAKPFLNVRALPCSERAGSLEFLPGWDRLIGIVPTRNLSVRLTGAVEYETSDGEVRHVSAGEFVLWRTRSRRARRTLVAELLG